MPQPTRGIGGKRDLPERPEPEVEPPPSKQPRPTAWPASGGWMDPDVAEWIDRRTWPNRD